MDAFPLSPVELLKEWRDFFVMIATAAATLIGAMFVVASIGMGFFNRSHAAAIGSFLTPTVIHLSAVIVLSALTMVPTLSWFWFGIGLGAGALGGLAYSGVVALYVARRRELVWSDQCWYAAAPVAGYAAMLASSVMALTGTPRNVELQALAMVLLVIGGIRNSWDMIVFLVTQERPDRERDHT